MLLSAKTKSNMDQIIKRLENLNYEIEIIGNEILTDNCTIHVYKDEVTVNDIKCESILELLHIVNKVERPQSRGLYLV